MRAHETPLVGGTARFLPLSPQVFHVLLALHDEPRHGYSVIQEVRLRTRGEMQLTASTLYDALARLVDRGLIQEVPAPDDGADERRDKRRRYYGLTALGRDVVTAEQRRLERLVEMARDTLGSSAIGDA